MPRGKICYDGYYFANISVQNNSSTPSLGEYEKKKK